MSGSAVIYFIIAAMWLVPVALVVVGFIAVMRRVRSIDDPNQTQIQGSIKNVPSSHPLGLAPER